MVVMAMRRPPRSNSSCRMSRTNVWSIGELVEGSLISVMNSTIIDNKRGGYVTYGETNDFPGALGDLRFRTGISVASGNRFCGGCTAQYWIRFHRRRRVHNSK